MGSAFLAKVLGTKDFKGTQKRQKGVFDLIIKAAVLLHSTEGFQPSQNIIQSPRVYRLFLKIQIHIVSCLTFHIKEVPGLCFSM